MIFLFVSVSLLIHSFWLLYTQICCKTVKTLNRLRMKYFCGAALRFEEEALNVSAGLSVIASQVSDSIMNWEADKFCLGEKFISARKLKKQINIRRYSAERCTRLKMYSHTHQSCVRSRRGSRYPCGASSSAGGDLPCARRAGRGQLVPVSAVVRVWNCKIVESHCCQRWCGVSKS